MGYDLYLLRREEVVDDPVAAYEWLEENEEREPTPSEEEHLRRLAADLQAASPGPDLVQPDVHREVRSHLDEYVTGSSRARGGRACSVGADLPSVVAVV